MPQVMAPSCVITTQPFSASLATQGNSWNVLHNLMNTVFCPIVFFSLISFSFIPLLPTSCLKKAPHLGCVASTFWELPPALPRYSPGLLSLQNLPCARMCSIPLDPTEFLVHFVSKGNKKAVFFSPPCLHGAPNFLGPEATTLTHWISQGENVASFYCVWGSFLNRN